MDASAFGDIDQVFLGEVGDSQNNKRSMKRISVRKVHKPVKFKLDSGASVSIVPKAQCHILY